MPELLEPHIWLGLFPPLDSSLDNQVLTRPMSRSCTKEKTLILEPQICSTNPRYIPMPPWEEKLMTSFICCFKETSTQFLKTIEDFATFSLCLDAFPYMSKMSMISLYWFISALQKKRLLSAKKKKKWDPWAHPSNMEAYNLLFRFRSI